MDPGVGFVARRSSRSLSVVKRQHALTFKRIETADKSLSSLIDLFRIRRHILLVVGYSYAGLNRVTRAIVSNYMRYRDAKFVSAAIYNERRMRRGHKRFASYSDFQIHEFFRFYNVTQLNDLMRCFRVPEYFYLSGNKFHGKFSLLAFTGCIILTNSLTWTRNLAGIIQLAVELSMDFSILWLITWLI